MKIPSARPTGSGKSRVAAPDSGSTSSSSPSRRTTGRIWSSSRSVCTEYGAGNGCPAAAGSRVAAQISIETGSLPSRRAAAAASRFVLPGRGAEPEDRRQPGSAKLLVQLQLLPRDVKEPAKVDVVRSGAQRAPHDVEVEPVVGGVDDHVCTLQRRAQRSGIAGVHVLRSLEPEVPRSHVRAPALEERRDVPSDRARCPDDGDHVRIVSWRWSSGPRVSAFWPPASSSCRAGSRPRRSSSPAPRAPASRTSTARPTSISPAGSAARTPATACPPPSRPCTSRSTRTSISASWSGSTNRTWRSAAGSRSCRRARARARRACS